MHSDSLFPGQHIPPPPPPVDLTLLPSIHGRLLDRYGLPPPHELWDPLKQFIYSLLSSRTKTDVSHAVMRDLEARFGPPPEGWENLRDAPVSEIERVIAAVTFPEAKAPRLKAALQDITARYGSLTLDFLAKYRTDKIRAWLEGFEGVGPKVSAAVVNVTTLRRRAIQLDSHHLRVVHRLGVTPRADARRTEELLMRMVPDTWDAAQLDQHHALVEQHGQELCTFAEPKCPQCPLLALCRYGQRNTGDAVAR